MGSEWWVVKREEVWRKERSWSLTVLVSGPPSFIPSPLYVLTPKTISMFPRVDPRSGRSLQVDNLTETPKDGNGPLSYLDLGGEGGLFWSR